MNIETIITLLSALTIAAQVILLIALILVITPWRSKMSKFLSDRTAALMFFISLMATVGSLFFSQIAEFPPCELCWFQRIFMYPLVILSGLAWYRREKFALKYTYLLIALGWIITAYHNYIYYVGVTQLTCSLNNHVSCVTPYFTRFNYISIPVMSLTAFSLLAFLALINIKLKKTKTEKTD